MVIVLASSFVVSFATRWAYARHQLV